MASAKPLAPQTWNRYSYVINNPLKYIDPSGQCTAPALKPGQVGICVEAFIAAKRIDKYGHGDNRTHQSNDPNATARMRISMIISASATEIDTNVTERLVAGSTAGLPILNNEAGEVTAEVGTRTLKARGDVTDSTSSTAPRGTEGFGDGITSSTTVRIGLRNGANGAQVLANDIQASAVIQGNTPAGVATAIAGGIAQAMAPPGTIDVNAQIRIIGSGDNTIVTGTAQSRPFPSVTGYAYIGMANGSVRTVDLFSQDETRSSDLTKPMRPIR